MTFGHHLVHLSTLIHRRYAQICADHDLTTAQAHLLCAVKDAPRGLSELGPLLGLARPGLSGLIDRAESRGLVQRITSATDRRALTLASTPLGKRTADALWADVGTRLPEVLDHLPPTDRADLARLVAAVTGDVWAGLP